MGALIYQDKEDRVHMPAKEGQAGGTIHTPAGNNRDHAKTSRYNRQNPTDFGELEPEQMC